MGQRPYQGRSPFPFYFGGGAEPRLTSGGEAAENYPAAKSLRNYPAAQPLRLSGGEAAENYPAAKPLRTKCALPCGYGSCSHASETAAYRDVLRVG